MLIMTLSPQIQKVIVLMSLRIFSSSCLIFNPLSHRFGSESIFWRWSIHWILEVSSILATSWIHQIYHVSIIMKVSHCNTNTYWSLNPTFYLHWSFLNDIASGLRVWGSFIHFMTYVVLVIYINIEGILFLIWFLNLRYPHCLFFLELLQNANFRNAMAHPGNKVFSNKSILNI